MFWRLLSSRWSLLSLLSPFHSTLGLIAVVTTPPHPTEFQAKRELPDEGCSDVECGNSPMLDSQGQPLDPNEEKRLKRMRRNRESAAMSRNRKKMYIEELEARVVELSASVQQLEQQNEALKQENAALYAAAGRQPPVPSSAGCGHPPKEGGAVAVEVDLPSAAPSASESPPAAAEDDESREERHAGSGGGKKGGVSAASLALMSALTFVTFSAVQSGGNTKHSPGARSLMSIEEMPPVPESISSLLQRARGAEMGGGEPLWPALKPLIERTGVILSEKEGAGGGDHSDLLQPDDAHSSTFKLDKTMSSSRVIKLPHNSSWGDALRFEALESRRSEHTVERMGTDNQIISDAWLPFAAHPRGTWREG